MIEATAPIEAGERENPTALAAGLIEGTHRVGIWGLGYIGGSTIRAFESAGIRVAGFDPDPDQASQCRADLDADARVGDRSDVVLADDVSAHFIAVPTERNGEPWDGALSQVATTIAQHISRRPGYRPLVVVESTLVPGTTARVVLTAFEDRGLVAGRDFLLGLAPRRDWFVGEGYTLATIDRVYGGLDAEASAEIRAILSLLCTRLHEATDYRLAEIVKPIENALRHVQITLSNQLSAAFPDIDIREALRLAGTKWNIDTFQPSFGTGGYCIPVSSRYLLRGAEHPQLLTILNETVATDSAVRRWVAEAVLTSGCSDVAILGLGYRADLRVAAMSPTFGIVEHLRAAGANVVVVDPLYTADEIESLTGAGTSEISELGRFEAVIVTADHSAFSTGDCLEAICAPESRVRLILDNFGGWANLAWPDAIDYRLAGTPHWLGDAPVMGGFPGTP